MTIITKTTKTRRRRKGRSRGKGEEEKEKGEEEKEKGEEEKEKKFLQTGGHTDQSKVVQEVLMDLKMKKGNLQPQPNKGVKLLWWQKGVGLNLRQSM